MNDEMCDVEIYAQILKRQYKQTLQQSLNVRGYVWWPSLALNYAFVFYDRIHLFLFT